MAIYPTAEPWKWAPEIEVGANVYMGQTMLLMPDLSKMQVKIAIPEDKIHWIKTGLVARTKLPNGTVEAQVSSVASVAAPGSRWTGNIVNYDTIVKLPELEGLKPGMSVEVEVIVAQYEDVLTIPVAAVIETEEGSYCWAKTPEGPERLSLEIGDTNDAFTIVEAGLTEGDEIYLNPLAFENVETDLPSPSDKPKTQATQQAPDSD
jgi:multidrug efflux pump subunit AcrA (membrane-fusion protein)